MRHQHANGDDKFPNANSLDDDISFIRVDTYSSIDSNATAPNLPGAGRTIGLLLAYLGSGLESFINRLAPRLGLGPQEVGKKLRRLRRHNETSIAERQLCSNVLLSEMEKSSVRKLCKKLLKYARYVVTEKGIPNFFTPFASSKIH